MTEPVSAQSALNLRLVLASFGLVVCLVPGVLLLFVGYVAFGVVLCVLAAVAAADLVLIQRRRRQRAAREGAGASHSLFE